MLADLRDFTRARLGGLVRVDADLCDVSEIVHNVVGELAAVHPDVPLKVERSGDLTARLDSKRVAQLLSNLVANALQHGAKDQVTILAEGNADTIILKVHNSGVPIAPDRIRFLFEPLRRDSGNRDDARLGLGLYIAQQIARAHGATIEATSDRLAGTSFIVRLPRVAPNALPSVQSSAR